MKKVIVVILALMPLLGYCQAKIGTRDYLDEKNGFKDLILGADINAIKSKLSFIDGDSKPDKDGCIYYDVKDAVYLSIGETVKIKSITIRTYQNHILDIFLILDKQYGQPIYEVFTKAYGIYSNKPNQFMEKYTWNTQKVQLYLNEEAGKEQAVVIYTSKPLTEQLDQIKSKKTEKGVSDL